VVAEHRSFWRLAIVKVHRSVIEGACLLITYRDFEQLVESFLHSLETQTLRD